MIYFIQSGDSGPIKIGYTNGDAESRLRGLQTGNPEKLNLIMTMPGSINMEKKLHADFEKDRLNGEWFQASGKLIEFITKQCRYYTKNLSNKLESKMASSTINKPEKLSDQDELKFILEKKKELENALKTAKFFDDLKDMIDRNTIYRTQIKEKAE